MFPTLEVYVFRSPEADYRAVRDMGLAAWWGASLMGLAGLVPASETQSDPAARHEVLDAGWSASRPFLTGAITAYIVGNGLVRFDGKPLENGKPRWISEGLESGPRTAALVTALAAALMARRLRDKEGELYSKRSSSEDLAEAASLRKRAALVHAVVPVALGWLMFSHLKEEVDA